jgi:hypothetical protein
MPGTARRLARRYLPTRVRRALLAVRDRRHKSAPARPRPQQKPETDQSQRNVLVEALRTGRPLGDAVIEQVRALLDAGRPHAAESIGASLRKEPDTAHLGALASAIVAFHRSYVPTAWQEFGTVPRELRWRHAASEYVRSGIKTDRATVLGEVRRLLAEAPDSVDPQSWSDILGTIYGAGEEDLARDIFAVFDRRIGDGTGTPKGLVEYRDWMRSWVALSADSPSAPNVPVGHVSFAIMDFGHPGRFRASANIGDHMQALASLGHVVRHQGLQFHGPQDLVDLLERLQGRVRPELQRSSVTADVDVITVDRDASMYKEVPQNTWALAFGWFMHPIFRVRYGFPFHRNLLPIFLSFHCAKRDLLTPEALEYLRTYGPIGCRDWTTVDLLLSVDVPAFFSGCMTATVNTVFPDLSQRPPSSAPVAYVDMPPETVPDGAVTYKHSNDAIRFRSFSRNVDRAVELLETYRGQHSAVVTSRLHCWLPARSIGVPVDFRPRNRSDIRFAGLIDTTDAEFDLMRDGINAKLERVTSMIMSGRKPADVYELWRSLNARDVEAARQRRAASVPAVAPAGRVLDDIASAVASTTTSGPARAGSPRDVHLAVHLPAAGQPTLSVLLESVTRNSSRGLHVWLLTREPEQVDVEELATLFPQVAISVVPTGGLGTGVRRGDGRKLDPRDLDLIVLGDLLPSVDRVIVLPVGTVVTDDIAELYDLDLGDNLLAAPSVVRMDGSSGFGVIHAASTRLGRRTAAATELRRRAYARHAFDFDAFTTDVLVLDLARSRAEKFVAEYLPYVTEFGLTFRDVLHFAAGPRRADVPERWDCVPTRSVVDRPGLIHWADPVKPWDDGYTPEQERWLVLADEVKRRHATL